MIEIPESHAYARQAGDMLSGRTVTDVFNATYPHKFTWYTGDPAAYRSLFAGKKVLAAAGYGAFVDLLLEDRVHIALSDGVHMRYCFLVFTVAMYGGINAFRDTLDNPYYLGALSKPSPLGDGFDAAYFDRLVAGAKPNLSAKAFLATQQRIPGLGNGVLQDILFNARIHPKRKMATLGERELDALFGAVKSTLAEMTAVGGRDTEKDLFGNSGGYKVVLSKNTYADPCPVCGGALVKEAYLGGAVYYCPHCQPLK